MDTSFWLVILGNLELTLQIGRGKVLGLKRETGFSLVERALFSSLYSYILFVVVFIFQNRVS